MKINQSRLLNWLLLVFVTFLVLYPLFMLMYGSFKGGPPGTPGAFTIDGYVRAYSSSETYNALWVTVWLSIVRVILAGAIALFLAWVVARTDTPIRKVLEFLVWLQIFLPLLPRVVAWTLLAGPQIGFLNKAAQALLHIEKPIFDIYSYGGIIWVSIFPLSTIIFMLITPAFKGMDAALEESSRMAGANNFTTFRHVTVPLLSPAILGAMLLGFILAMESFEPELFLGYNNGIFVYTTRVWWLLGITPADFPQAMALSTVFLLIVSALVYLQWRLLRNRNFVTVTGRGFAIRPIRLGKWKYVTLGLVLIYFITGTLLPLLTLILGSFMKLWGIWVVDPFTLKHWERTLDDPRFFQSLKNTLILGVGTATAGMLLFSLISYVVTRSKFVGRRMLDLVSWLPYGVPGLVLAIGFLWAFVGGLPIFVFLRGTLWLMMLAFVVRGMPTGVRVMNGAMIQVGTELEESSRVLGASWVYTFRRIIAPLLTPSFISAWILLFLLSVRDLVTVVFLYSSKSRVLSIIMFEHWWAGEYERANVVGLILTILLLGLAMIAKNVGARQEVPT
ncbi:MAG: iron ABC transporter permease [Dehalococcoidia bacterium]|nr:Iron ABC transporter permease [Dehalococcoidia bacterium]MBF8304020.1 Iron transporter permease [Dehalococcoidia bacterium]MDO8634939.1 iron ABC transporter permease [Dehalococcoidia bacterium]